MQADGEGVRLGVSDRERVALRVGVAVRLSVGVGDCEQAVQFENKNAPAMGLHVKPPGQGMIAVAFGK